MSAVTPDDLIRFAAWAVAPELEAGLIDVALYHAGGYDATITASTRRIFDAHPVLAPSLVGLGVGGLAMHFFGSFPRARGRNAAAPIAFGLGAAAGALFVRRRLYG